MGRAGLTRERIVEAAATAIDSDGLHSLTIARLADSFGVRPPSLYHHVGGIEDVIDGVAVRTVDALADTCREAAMGRAGADALRAVAATYRRFAGDHPGTYPLTQVVRTGEDWQAASRRALEPFLACLAGMGIEGDNAIHAIRLIRSALHGFAELENRGGFGIEVPIEDSFRLMVDAVLSGIAAFEGTSPT